MYAHTEKSCIVPHSGGGGVYNENSEFDKIRYRVCGFPSGAVEVY